MQLIRIEDPKNGLGVWRSNDDQHWAKLRAHSQFDIICRRHNTPKFPLPFMDKELMADLAGESFEDYHFGFLSLEQLQEGFTKDELKELIKDLGFRVYSIEASQTKSSSFQVIFKPESITSKQDISFMFE
jgi:hypothetical protein